MRRLPPPPAAFWSCPTAVARTIVSLHIEKPPILAFDLFVIRRQNPAAQADRSAEAQPVGHRGRQRLCAWPPMFGQRRAEAPTALLCARAERFGSGIRAD